MVFAGAGLLVLLLLALAPRAQASCSISCSWTGETAGTSGSSLNWSATTNWAAGEGPVPGSNGTLSFPALPACPPSPGPIGNACYRSNNDLSGVSVDKLVIDGTSPYQVSGNAITLGAGGLSTTAAGSGTSSPFVSNPITLGADQAWTIDGGVGAFRGRLVLLGAVTGETRALHVEISHASTLNLSGDNEVGAVTVTGDGSGNLGFASPFGSSLNGGDGRPVTVSDAGIFTFYELSLGPLTLDEGVFQLGAEAQAPKVTIDGDLRLGPTNAVLLMQLGPAASPSPGTNYSQISAGGNVSLGNSSLQLNEATRLGACDSLTPGAVYSLVKTTAGALTGTFTDAPDGSIRTVGCNTGGGGTPSTVRIDYTPTSVTATVVSTTTTTLSADSSAPVTNQPVTLTADVTTGSGSEVPTGGVEFANNGTPIPGCSAQPLDSSGQATCETSFSASSSPELLTATYGPADGSHFAGSATAAPDSLTVAKDSTATALSPSNASPQLDQSITYTATVTPSYSGSARPSGTVRFTDGGSPVAGCSSQPLADSGPLTATCTMSYSSAGSHSIAASFAGDGDFEGSSSSSHVITVAEAANPAGGSGNAPPPSPGPSGQDGPKTKAQPTIRSCVRRVASYKPATIVKGRTVPGVRLRLRVGSPSRIEGHARLEYRLGGRNRGADLGKFSLDDGGVRNLQLRLSPGLRRDLRRGTTVVLDVEVRAEPRAPGARCSGPRSTHYRIRTKIVMVLAAPSR